eukprot:gene19405-biopygen10028
MIRLASGSSLAFQRLSRRSGYWRERVGLPNANPPIPLLQEQGRAPIHGSVWCGKICMDLSPNSPKTTTFGRVPSGNVQNRTLRTAVCHTHTDGGLSTACLALPRPPPPPARGTTRGGGGGTTTRASSARPFLQRSLHSPGSGVWGGGLLRAQ